MRGVAASALVVLLAAGRLAVAQPANDDWANATVITSLPFTDRVDTTTATAEPGEPAVCNGGANSVWYRIPAEAAETLFWASTAGSTAPQFRVTQFTGSCGALTSFACDLSNDVFPEVAIAPLGQDVLVRVNGSGTLSLGVKRLPEFLVAYPGGRYASVAGGPNGFLVASGGFDLPGGEGRRPEPLGGCARGAPVAARLPGAPAAPGAGRPNLSAGALGVPPLPSSSRRACSSRGRAASAGRRCSRRAV